jgi:hypothetical protein
MSTLVVVYSEDNQSSRASTLAAPLIGIHTL